jgi:hypothetical protein
MALEALQIMSFQCFLINTLFLSIRESLNLIYYKPKY